MLTIFHSTLKAPLLVIRTPLESELENSYRESVRAMMALTPIWWEVSNGPDDELSRRRIDEADDIGAVNGTLNAMYGAWLQKAIDEQEEQDGYAAIEDGNANLDLEQEVEEELEENEAENTNKASWIRARIVERDFMMRRSRTPFARTVNDKL